MPGNTSKLPPPANKSKLKLSGGSSTESKSNINLISAQGKITSPKGFNQSNRPSNLSPTSSKIPKVPSVAPGPDLTQHPLYKQVQKLSSELRPFLQYDYETNNTYKLTKLKYYNILRHFDPQTSSLPTDKKDVLKAAFKNNLLPKLLPFCTEAPTPTDSMDTDEVVEDFDPLHRRTTIAMLASAIHKIKPHVNISLVALKDEVLALYKHHVNPNLRLPQNSDYTQRPRLVHTKFVPKLSIQVLRHAIQSYCPDLFLNCSVLRLANYISIYRVHLLEESQASTKEELVEGYHYWVNKDLKGTAE